MTRRRAFALLVLLIVLVSVFSRSGPGWPGAALPDAENHAAKTRVHDVHHTRAQSLLANVGSPFVPNVGQWTHRARFVHRAGSMTVFLEDRGWVLDLVERVIDEAARSRRDSPVARCTMPRDRHIDREVRRAAVRMTFEGEAHIPVIVGEKKLEGHHNYFLGADETRWRTDVPLYGSVRYEKLYPGIDLRLRDSAGVPEYDLLLRPGADLSRVTVRVEGGRGLSIAGDGSLVIETALGPLTQSVPKTWQVGDDGSMHEVACHFTRLDSHRFGFEAPGWDGDTSLTIDPGLIWSTFLGGNAWDEAFAVSVDDDGMVTVAGGTSSTNFPTTSNAFDSTFNGGSPSFWADAFVSLLDPSKTGTAQLVYSTFFGGSDHDYAAALSVDAGGVVTLTGRTTAANYPTTRGAYDTTYNGGRDAFVCRLDPSKVGAAQLVYSTFLGGGGHEEAAALSVDTGGLVTVAGDSGSTDFPTSKGAYDTSYNGGSSDAFVCRLDPSKTGSAQLVYSTFLGGNYRSEFARALCVSVSGVLTVTGETYSSNFPTTRGAYDSTHDGSWDVFVSRLDPRKTGSAQLVYSTFLGGKTTDSATGLAVDRDGVVTIAGWTFSPFPTTSGAFDRTHNGGTDIFVSRLDPRKTGVAQLVYSTFIGGNSDDQAFALSVDTEGVVTVAGGTYSRDYPTTGDAYDRSHNGLRYMDAIVSRLDPSKAGVAQMMYSTLLGGTLWDEANALAVDASGVVTVAGQTLSSNFPTTNRSYDRTHNGGGPFYGDVFVSRVDMGVAFYADRHRLSLKTGGTQELTVNAGKAHANRSYWIFGSVSGTTPGLNLLGVHIPLNPDKYTEVAMAHVNSAVFTRFRGTLDANGVANASFRVPANLPLPSGFTFHHAYIVYDASGRFYMASDPAQLYLK